MTRPDPSHAIHSKRFRLAWLGLAGAAAAPLLVFVACVLLRAELLPLSTALDLVTLRIAWPLSWFGAVSSLFAIWAARSAGRGGWIPAALAVVVSLLTLDVFLNHFRQADSAAATRPDVVTNVEDPPGFSAAMVSRRRAAGAVDLGRWAADMGTCPGVAAVMSQVAPGVAGYALQEAGFQINSLGVGRADGVRTGFWFGREWDAVLRIRPGRTDIRVTARDDRPSDDGEACRLATKIADNLQVRE